MRRESDRREGERTGGGRRERDRILAGETTPSPVIRSRYELQNLLLFLSDDLRECALAVNGIESFLLRAKRVLESSELTPAELAGLVDDREITERCELLWDALTSLRRSMGSIHESLARNRG